MPNDPKNPQGIAQRTVGALAAVVGCWLDGMFCVLPDAQEHNPMDETRYAEIMASVRSIHEHVWKVYEEIVKDV